MCVCVYIYDNRVIKFILCSSLWVICCFFKLISYLAFPQISSKDFISVSEIQINTFIKRGTLILESGNSEVMFFSTWLVLITSLLTVICVFKKCWLTIFLQYFFKVFISFYVHSSVNSNFCSYIKNYIVCTKSLTKLLSSSENMNESSEVS